MAFDSYLVDRITGILQEKKIPFLTKKMMGGMLFMVNDKMFCGTHIDKKYGDSLLMVRVGENNYQQEIHKPECLPMDFTGRPMKGYLFVTPDGFDLDSDLTYWIDLCLLYNPEAKSTKKESK